MCPVTERVRRIPTPVRALRGGLVASTAAALAMTAHRAAGGTWPDGGTTLVLTALVAVAATAMADRRRHPLAVIATMAVAQLAMHVLLDLADSRHGVVDGPVVDGGAMTAAHSVAALLAALVLAKADVCLVALAGVLRATLPVPRPTQLAHVEPVPFLAAVPTVDVVREVMLRRSCARRGPPRSR